MRARILVPIVATALMAACGDGAGDDTTTTADDGTTTTTVAETTTTASETTTTTEPTTTTAATTTTLPLPAQVTGLTVGLGGGSEEVAVTWEPSPDDDQVTWYNVYFSEMPGGTKAYVDSIHPHEMIGDKVGFIDHPRSLIDGQTCYIVRARNESGEGPASDEACFDHTA